MSFFKNCCEWACARIVVACYANDLISVASTEHLLSRPVREVIEAGIHEKMYRQKQLFNRHGYNLAIFKGGHVKGVREAFHPNAVLELSTVGVGEVKILGLESNLFLAMNAEGQLYGEEDGTNESTVFVEKTHGTHLVYLSKKFSHFGWYIGIKKTGQGKNGQLTWYPWGQKAIQFVARKPYATPHPLRQLQNRHGLTLVILEDGTVKGIRDESSVSDVNKSTVMEFIPSVPLGAYKIRSVSTGLFLAMDSKGKLYGEHDRNEEGTIFAEHTEGPNYFVYLSVRYAHFGWHVGIKRSGKAKTGQKTWHPANQKAIQFIRKLAYNQGSNDPGSDLTKKFEQILPPITYIDDDEQDHSGSKDPLNGSRNPLNGSRNPLNGSKDHLKESA